MKMTNRQTGIVRQIIFLFVFLVLPVVRMTASEARNGGYFVKVFYRDTLVLALPMDMFDFLDSAGSRHNTSPFPAHLPKLLLAYGIRDAKSQDKDFQVCLPNESFSMLDEYDACRDKTLSTQDSSITALFDIIRDYILVHHHGYASARVKDETAIDKILSKDMAVLVKLCMVVKFLSIENLELLLITRIMSRISNSDDVPLEENLLSVFQITSK